MPKKALHALLLFILTGHALVFALFFKLPQSEAQGSAAPVVIVEPSPESVRPPPDFRIRIPSVDIDVAIESVGLTPEGEMDVPSGPDVAGWYEIGPRPGETGSAVIDGHVDDMNGTPAAFAGLKGVKPGETIEVQDEKGSVVSFVVRKSRVYDADADATDVFVSQDGKAHLNLITCAGAWDKNARQYAKRLVVFADRE